jgi:glucose/arabinose dehydrogenase
MPRVHSATERHRRPSRRTILTAVVAVLIGSACGGSGSEQTTPISLVTTEVTTTVAETDQGGAGTTAAPAIAEEPPWTRQELTLTTIAEVDQAVALAPRSGSLDLYVAAKTGTIHRIARTVTRNRPDRFRLDNTAILDISDQVSSGNEQGLLDLAFSSDGRQLYVSYTDRAGANVIVRYAMGSLTAEVSSRREILRIEQPFSNHNGGGITFGPDGFLYVGIGDGGRAGDPLGSGQDTNSLLGAILRIDPDGAADGLGYSVPNGNPYVDGGGAPEVWLTGVRNPWRFSFDPATDALWVADVGQNRFEEVTRLDDGGWGANLGWNQMEGNQPFDGGTEPENHVGPWLVYAHENGRCSITGGGVYRGQILPLYDGVYLFGDYCTGEIFGAVDSPGGVIVRKLNVALGDGELGAFGVDSAGEMYVVSLDGPISRIEPMPAEE